jgi:hypothetical protein
MNETCAFLAMLSPALWRRSIRCLACGGGGGAPIDIRSLDLAGEWMICPPPLAVSA